MKGLLIFVIAALLAGLAGAYAGGSMSAEPVLNRGGEDVIPSSSLMAASNNAMRRSQSTPEHYPLKTQDGTIPVADLALNGRLRNRREAAEQAPERYEPPEIELPELAIDRHAERIAASRRERQLGQREREVDGVVFERSTQVQPVTRRSVSRAEAEMALGGRSEPGTDRPPPRQSEGATGGSARVVDVEEELGRFD